MTEVTHVDNLVERQLILKIKEGDQQAFHELILLFEKKVFRLAWGFFQDRDEAMEIVQETFLKVYEKIDRYDERARFQDWLLRIAKNLCIDNYRKNKRRKLRQQDVFELVEKRGQTAVESEDRVDRDSFQQSLEENITALSNRQRLVFVMKHYNLLKYQEIARVLKISVGTVKSLHHRASKRLQKKLAHYEVSE